METNTRGERKIGNKDTWLVLNLVKIYYDEYNSGR